MSRLIDADALEVVTAKVPKGMDAKRYMAGMEYVLSQIDALPTIEERKTGKWIVFEAPDELHCGLVKCPFCKEELIAKPDEYSYCPNCGAKMEGEQP